MTSDIGNVMHIDGHGTHSQGNSPVPPPPAPLPGDPTAHLVAIAGRILPTLDSDTARRVAIVQLEHARDLSARTATAFDQILDAIRRPDRS